MGAEVPAGARGLTATSAAYLIVGVRTPLGKYGGSLASVRPDDLAALVVGEALRRAAAPPDAVDEVILGAANQAGEDNRNVARMAVLLAGLPDSVPGFTVNRLCASGLTAVASASQAILAGEADLVVAGGVESMTRAPWVSAKPATRGRCPARWPTVPWVGDSSIRGWPRSTAARRRSRWARPRSSPQARHVVHRGRPGSVDGSRAGLTAQLASPARLAPARPHPPASS